MPTFDIADPRTGRQLTIEGDSEPTESELEQLFAATEPIPTVQPFYSGESTIAGAPGRNPLVGTPRIWENLGGPTPNPTRAAAEALIGQQSDLQPEESVLGISPNRIATGAEMTKSTGIPKFLTIPVSGVLKAGAGLGQFLTSPQGGVEMGVAAIPGIGLVQRAKFIHDMAKGTGESSGNLAAEIENAARNPQQVDSDAFQRMAEETANTALTLYGAGKLTSHEFSRITGVRAPLGRFAESEKTRISKDVAEQLLKTVRDEQLPLAEDMVPVPGLIPPNAPRELGLPPVTTEPFLQPGVPDLADAALREYMRTTVAPGAIPRPALQELRRAINPPAVSPEQIALAERVQGGGQAPYGKTSFMREAEAPTTTRTQAATQAERDMLQSVVDEAAAQGIEIPKGNLPPGVSYRRPKVAPTLAEQEKRQARESVAQGLTGESGYYTDEPRTQPLPEPAPQPERTREGVTIVSPETGRAIEKPIPLSALQRSRLRAALARGASEESILNILRLKEREPAQPQKRKERPNALEPEAAQSFFPLRQEPGQSASEVPPEENRPPTDEGGGGVPVEPAPTKPVAPRGGSESSLTPEQQAISRANNGRKAFAEAMGVPYIEGESNADFLKRVNEKKLDIPEKKVSESPEVIAEPPSPNAPQVRTGTTEGTLKSPDTSGKTTPPSPGIVDKAISNIESLQSKLRKGPQSGQTLMGVPSAILDTALEAARLALKAGKSVAEAIEEAMKHIRFNVDKGKYDESKVRQMFESELAGDTKKPAARPAVANGERTAATPKRESSVGGGGGNLDDIYRIFEPAPKEETSLGQTVKTKGVNLIEAIRTGLSSKFRPINKLAEDIAKAYGRTSSKDIAGIMEQLKGSQGKGEAEIYRFEQDVSKRVKGSEKDFNAYLFLRRSLDRLTQDQKDIGRAMEGEEVKTLNRRRVADYTINSLTAKLKTLEDKLGPDKLADFKKAANDYQTYMDESLRLQAESGRMSPEVYETIKNGSQFYAPFKVMKYLEETSRPEGTGANPIDTVADFTKAMEGIEDKGFRLGDMLGAARQNILLSRILADKNVAMRHVAELAAFDTDGRFIKRLKPNEQPPTGMEAVNVLENGKRIQYAINKDAAEAVKLYGGNAGGVIVRMMGALSVPFRAGATALNLPFQISNLMADQPRAALVSKYGIRGPTDLVRYPLDFVHALYSSIAGDMFGKDNKLFQDFLDSGVAGTTVQEMLTPEALKFKEPSLMSKSAKLGQTVLSVIPKFAQAIEQTSKVLGVKRAMRFENAESGKQLALAVPEAITELRRFSGSPDFGRQGKWVEQARLNLLYMFLNARIQGAVADVGRLTGRDGGKMAAQTWLKVGAAVGIPTAYLYYLNNRPEYKDDYDKRSTQEKQNYWLIPKDSYITTEDGQKMRDYWRVPKREISKWFANLTEAALNFADKKNPQAAKDFGNQMVQEISPVNIQGNTAQERLESVASGLNPLIKAPLELATGRDLYRHREIMSDQLKKASPEQQYTDRTAEAFKKIAVAMPDVAPEFLRSPIVLENLTRNLTAGLFTQFLARKPVEGRTKLENTPLLQRFQALPYEDNTAFKEELQGLERDAADEQLARHRAATKLLDDNKGKPLDEIANKVDDPKVLKHMVDLWVSKENGATMQDRQLLALPAKQRAQYILHKLEGLTPEKKDAMIQDFARKRVLTEAVVQEMGDFLK